MQGRRDDGRLVTNVLILQDAKKSDKLNEADDSTRAPTYAAAGSRRSRWMVGGRQEVESEYLTTRPVVRTRQLHGCACFVLQLSAQENWRPLVLSFLNELNWILTFLFKWVSSSESNFLKKWTSVEWFEWITSKRRKRI